HRVDVGKVLGTAQTARDLGATLGAAGAGLTALGDARLAHLDADVSSRSTFAGGAVASVTAAVTVGTNNDKTGYTVSTVSDKTGYSLSQSFPTNFAALSIDIGGVVKSNLSQILGTALTETAGQIAAAFKKFFNI